jgi:hypothetical protein
MTEQAGLSGKGRAALIGCGIVWLGLVLSPAISPDLAGAAFRAALVTLGAGITLVFVGFLAFRAQRPWANRVVAAGAVVAFGGLIAAGAVGGGPG